MNKNIKILSIVFLAFFSCLIACKKTEYSLGGIKTPTNLSLTALVVGVDTANPAGDGSGLVTINTSATNVLTYKVDFGDGHDSLFSSSTFTHKYRNPGTSDYIITVSAIGTGGAISTISKTVQVYVKFDIPQYIIQDLTNGSSQIWITDNDTIGHVGVGEADMYFPNYYAATPNSRASCQYDDEITFSKDANNNILMSINNMGQTFIIAAATSYYGFSGGDGCYALNNSGVRKLTFQDATSTSTSANSTRIQFEVPGDGTVNFATGAKDNAYEILTITPTTVQLRNIGIDGNAWYQILKVKP